MDRIAPPGTSSLERILVAVDLGESSRRALMLALELADGFGATVTLVHVWDVPPYPFTSLAAPMVRRAVEQAAREAFDEIVADAKSRRAGVTGVLEQGTAWREILRTAERIDADVVVLGTHGPQRLPHALLGSVAEKVVRLSPIPVLTVPTVPS